MRRHTSSFMAILVTLTLALSIGQAQEFRSTISGQVVDAQGAVVPGAVIAAKNADTGAAFTTKSGETGQFTLPFVPPGTYTIAAEAPGFKQYARQRLAVTANQRISIDIVLEVGSASESVTVSSAAPLLEAGTASVGQGMTGAIATEMPMSGRTPLALARLSIGVVDLGNPGWARPFDNGSVANSAMGGGRSLSNELLMDGSPVMYQQANSARAMSYSPPLAAVAEVRTEVFQSDAAYGDTSSGTINVITKSGTNQLHGSAEEYNQVSKLSATPFFYNRAGQPNPVTHWNQWSATVGGPLYIPKVFHGSNRVFWFFAYEGIHDSRPTATVATTTTVPTAAERNGDFSALLQLGSNYQIYDPSSGVAQGSRIQRQPLPGNVIPTNRLNPLALKLLSYYPLPNQVGTTNGQNNYLSSPQDSNHFYNFLGRTDINLSSRHKLSFSGRSSYRLENLNQLFLTNNATGIHRSRENWGAIVDDVYSFNPTTFLNTRVSWNRFIDQDEPLSSGFDVTSIGLPSYLAAASLRPELPWITFSDATQGLGGTGGGGATGFRTPYDSEQIYSTLNKQVSKHSLKIGLDIRRIRESSINYGNASGQFIFGTQWTNGPQDNSSAAPLGQSLAAFLLGLPTDGGFDVNAFRTNQAWYQAFFIQDDWRIKPSLTINLGLRYEHETPTTERYNRTEIGFDFTSANKITAAAKQAYAAAPLSLLPAAQFNPVGGPLFASSGHRNIYDTPTNGWGPRIGVAYRPAAWGGRTVIRAGAGVFYQPYLTVGVQQAGFSQRTPLVASQNGYLTPYSTLGSPFPDGIQPPTGAANGLNTNLGKSLTFFNPKLAEPYTARWTLTLQRELVQGLLFEVAYMGSYSSNLTLTSNQNLNTIPRNYLSTSPARDQATINALTAIVSNPFQGLLPGTGINGPTTTAQQLLLPYPQYSGDGSITEQFPNLGRSNYNALDIRIEKKLSQGAQFLISYSLSKDLAAVSFLNPSDARPEYKVASEDRPQRLVASGTYALPFGQGKLRAGKWLNRVIGGWSLNGIALWQIGSPLNWGNVIYYGGDVAYVPGNIDHALDTTRFNTNSGQQLSLNVRTFSSAFGSLRGPSQKNLDASLRKDFRIHEKISAQLVLDSFNATNRVQFSVPNLNPAQAAFGTVTGQDNRPHALQLALRLKW